MTSCNPVKHLGVNSLFLSSNHIHNLPQTIKKEEIKQIIKQKPNKKILQAFRFHLGIYNLFYNNDPLKIKHHFGEAPVVYDSLLTNKSLKEMEIFLYNQGYFDAEISAKKLLSKKKVKIIYNITPNSYYSINKIDFQSQDQNILSLIKKQKSPYINVGSRYQLEALEKERNRVVRYLQNEGYYHFSKEHIRFLLDSNMSKKTIDLLLIIEQQKQNTGFADQATIYQNHKRYTINNLEVFIDVDNKRPLDTIIYDKIGIIKPVRPKYKSRFLNYKIDITPNYHYQLSSHENTYKQLSSLGLFKSIDIGFKPISPPLLDCQIHLKSLPTKSFSISANGTHSGGDLGIRGSISYQNKNLFHAGETFSIDLNSGIEVQQLLINQNVNDQEVINRLPFNTVEIGPSVSLTFPRFLLPIKMERFSKNTIPSTFIKFNLLYQRRPDYISNATTYNISYKWNESRFKQHIVSPLDIGFVKINPSESFKQRLEESTNPYIQNTFSDHLIISTKYSFIYNNQAKKQNKPVFFRYNIEFSGNTLSRIHKTLEAKKDTATNSYALFGVRYAQFIKTDFDFRKYWKSQTGSTVGRIAFGVGVPYGNLNALPFAKSFFAGGSNGIRAWRARTLGVGSLHDSLITSSIDQIGALRIESNLEYRYKIIGNLHGALFIDGGNVWLLKKDNEKPNGEFNVNRLWQDIALGAGIGLRFDFTYFILRIDGATPIKVPSVDRPKVITPYFRRSTLNLGIGYPF